MAELSIKIKIGNREYPMKVRPEDESMVRQMGKLINEKMKVFQTRFGIQDKQDLLAMVAIESFIERSKSKVETESNDEVALAQIRNMADEITQAIK